MSQSRRDAKHDPQPGDKFAIYDCRFEIVSNDGTTVEDECYEGGDKGQRFTTEITHWRRLMSNARVLRRSK